MSFHITLLALFLHSTIAFIANIDANGEQCFFDILKFKDTVNFNYEVLSGGFLDIDLKITGPDGMVIVNEERKSNGHYSFKANREGRFTYCLSNKMSSMTPKMVMFEMHSQKKNLDNNPNASPDEMKLTSLVNELSTSVFNVRLEMDYLNARENIHMTINESTNFRVVLWAFLECALLILMSVGQVIYLRRFFEVKRII